MDEYRIGTRARAETNTRAVTELVTGTRMGVGRNDDRIGEGGGESKKHNKPRTRGVDAILETGEIWVEREKRVDNKGFVQ